MMSGSVWIRLIRTSCCSSAETCGNTHQIQASLKIISISRTDGTSQLSGEGESHWGKTDRVSRSWTNLDDNKGGQGHQGMNI